MIRTIYEARGWPGTCRDSGAAEPPEPAGGDWHAWQALIADRTGPRGSAINVPDEGGFGTICSSLAGVSEAGHAVWRFAAGPPDHAPFLPVSLP